MINAHDCVVAIYEMALAQAKREIQNYPESDPRNAVLAADIEWTEKKLKQIQQWNVAWKVHKETVDGQH